jgi:hypothetical protein
MDVNPEAVSIAIAPSKVILAFIFIMVSPSYPTAPLEAATAELPAPSPVSLFMPSLCIQCGCVTHNATTNFLLVLESLLCELIVSVRILSSGQRQTEGTH